MSHAGVESPIDRENIAQYNLKVVATDNGTPAQTNITYVIIDILDVNGVTHALNAIGEMLCRQSTAISSTLTVVKHRGELTYWLSSRQNQSDRPGRRCKCCCEVRTTQSRHYSLIFVSRYTIAGGDDSTSFELVRASNDEDAVHLLTRVDLDYEHKREYNLQIQVQRS